MSNLSSDLVERVSSGIPLTNLPGDLAEEVLSRIPLTSMRRVRSTCKKWNTLCKGRNFAKKHLGRAKVAAAKELMVVMMMEYKVYLMSVNLHKNVESCIKRQGKLISLDDSDISKIFHCDGLFLCITKDFTRLVVWNPYWGQIRWIEPSHNFDKLDLYLYALGHDKSNQSYKILRFVDCSDGTRSFVDYKIYDCNSDSWRVLDVTSNCFIHCFDRGVSLKGNTYWFGREKLSETTEGDDTFLICFDFTRERFGPHLPLPFDWCDEDTLSLSSVREEQLAVFFQRWDTLHIEIWVTTKIEPNAVSWNSKVFLAVDMRPLLDIHFQFPVEAASFFIDEEKNVAVVFDKNMEDLTDPTRNVAYIIGGDGSLKVADLGESAHKHCSPLVCSYVPSLVQLN